VWKHSRILRKGRAVPAWVFVFRKWVYLAAFAGLGFLIIESGLQWRLPSPLPIVSGFVDYIVFVLFFADSYLTFRFTYPKRRYFRSNWLDLLVIVPVLMNVVSMREETGLILIRHAVVLIKLFTRTRRFSRLLMGVRLNTAQIVLLSFIGAIMIGTVLLTFPTATTDGRGAGFVDALFTATSATCVTGLIVQDTPTYFSTFGQVVILVLIQLGGLGIMTFSAFIALLIGRFTLGQRKFVQEMLEEERNIFNMVFYIFKMTFIIELAGAVLLFSRFYFHFPSPGRALYVSVFHAVSAFCNAGFSLFSDSLEHFPSDPMINGVIAALIVLGGLGFVVVFELTRRARKRQKKLSPHSRLVLTTSAVLVGLGFFVIFFVEFDGALLSLSVPGKIWASLFQSVTTRTAGFNTVPISAFSGISLTLMCILMFIGASPGSTGGGIKTSTFAILLLSIKSSLWGKKEVDVFKRTIPIQSVIRALAIMVLALLLVAFVFMGLLVAEDKPYLSLLFESVSAFGTVGLSTGVTPDLTSAGKILIILLMYLGRVGPLTLALALTRKSIKGKIEYPEARVLIG
jgi:trk system potassium uptake protein TrkH